VFNGPQTPLRRASICTMPTAVVNSRWHACSAPMYSPTRLRCSQASPYQSDWHWTRTSRIAGGLFQVLMTAGTNAHGQIQSTKGDDGVSRTRKSDSEARPMPTAPEL